MHIVEVVKEFYKGRLPIFNGPPGFVILAVVIALAAYLRQIAVGALTEIGLIAQVDNSTPYPYRDTSEEARQNQIAFLSELLDTLTVLTKLFFFAGFVISIRIFVTSICPDSLFWILNVFDVFYTFAIVCTVGLTWGFHARSHRKAIRLRNDAIRARSKD